MRQCAAPVLLQRDAAVPPRGGQIEARGYEAPVGRGVREKHDAQGGEPVGDGAQAEQEKHLLLETSPLPEESDCSLIVDHSDDG